MAWIIKNLDDVVLYVLPQTPAILADHVECVHPTRLTPLHIWDLNDSNCSTEEVDDADVPVDFTGHKYLHSGGVFSANPDWIDPENPPE